MPLQHWSQWNYSSSVLRDSAGLFLCTKGQCLFPKGLNGALPLPQGTMPLSQGTQWDFPLHPRDHASAARGSKGLLLYSMGLKDTCFAPPDSMGLCMQSPTSTDGRPACHTWPESLPKPGPVRPPSGSLAASAPSKDTDHPQRGA